MESFIIIPLHKSHFEEREQRHQNVWKDKEIKQIPQK